MEVATILTKIKLTKTKEYLRQVEKTIKKLVLVNRLSDIETAQEKGIRKALKAAHDKQASNLFKLYSETLRQGKNASQRGMLGHEDRLRLKGKYLVDIFRLRNNLLTADQLLAMAKKCQANRKNIAALCAEGLIYGQERNGTYLYAKDEQTFKRLWAAQLEYTAALRLKIESPRAAHVIKQLIDNALLEKGWFIDKDYAAILIAEAEKLYKNTMGNVTMKKWTNALEQAGDPADGGLPPLPAFHQNLFAHELTLKRASSDMRKIEAPLSAAMVDLNPHQVDAALFAFKGPMSRGAILCDEVGLGKTIEAGLVICQMWAEGKRKIIVVVPASIRKQWQNELIEKFGIPCVIVDGFEYKQAKKSGTTKPFDRDEVVIVSIPFAANKAEDIAAVGRWHLCVIDEAHRLRNVYKKIGNVQSKKLKDLFGSVPKILLTATPLQNALLELYGLTSFIDDRFFASEYAFRAKYMADSEGREEQNLELLKERLSGMAIRTIRKQVQEYIPYTNRISMVEDFTPSDEELELYDRVSAYLQKPEIASVQARQRHLMILIYRKILASSSFAIAATLQSLVGNLEKRLKGLKPDSIEDIVRDVDGYEEEEEEISEIDTEASTDGERTVKSSESVSSGNLRDELAEVLEMKTLAESIQKNAKGDALLIALEKAFFHARKFDWSEKAVIFTESRRTQEYLLKLLSDTGYKDKITLFNGDNKGPIAKRAFSLWEKERTHLEGEGLLSKAAVIREALISEFKNHTQIMISTEAGAEGINLQFCNIVINYDLPWNPQRVEQRIGRCHRYGQKNDVVVLNFLNRSNAADRRVFELLDQKFRLFNGIFGASDEVLGAIGSGVDFEKRILDIYQACRTEAEINAAFDSLQSELAEQINQKMVETRTKLLENFDDEVSTRFRVINRRVKEDLSVMDLMLSRLVVSALGLTEYEMANGCCAFEITDRAAKSKKHGLEPGTYYIGRFDGQRPGERLHIAHRAVSQLIHGLKTRKNDASHQLKLCYTTGRHKISQLEPYIGKSGTWAIYKAAFEGLDTEEHLIHCVMVNENGEWTALSQELADKFAGITAEATADHSLPPLDEKLIDTSLSKTLRSLTQKIGERNEEYYDAELDRLEIYAEESLMRLQDELKKKGEELAEARKKKQKAETFDERQAIRKEIHKLELEYSRLSEKIAAENKRLFEEKDKEMKKLEKKLDLRIQKSCIARAYWVME
ncbi:MAG: DEAD/DEAH box helicase family protein [Nitrospirae bacterium]|nr:DEAD/DEAH box helicase family protein [Nitrospirota bacterium]